MIRVLIEGDESERFAPFIRQLARSFPKDVYDPERICVVTDDEPVPEDLTGVGLLIENRAREPAGLGRCTSRASVTWRCSAG